jgi:uncharacterized protein (DUF2384 family)
VTLYNIEPSTASRADIERLAVEMTGTREDARRWLGERCMGLDGAIPSVLMRSSSGRELVATFLLRVVNGVYV